MQHQALATGRPIIRARYRGVAEYFTSEMGYEVSFKRKPAEGMFAGPVRVLPAHRGVSRGSLRSSRYRI